MAKNEKPYEGFLPKLLGLSNRDEALALAKELIPLEIVLSDPMPIEVNESLPSVNTGMHHSKDFIRDVANAVQGSWILKRFVKSIKSHAYNPHKRNSIELMPAPYQQNQFVLRAFDRRDEGFGVEIDFWATEKWKVVFLAKLLKSKVNYFKGYRLDIRV